MEVRQAQPALGLRERKKVKTRAAIRSHALHLFRTKGYDGTTTEQIAEAAEVSPSTLFRYFPTKESLVLDDEFDPVITELLRRQPPELNQIGAIRATFRTFFDGLSVAQRADLLDRMALSLSVPALRGAMLDRIAGGIDVLVGAVAERSRLAPDHPAVRTLAGAVIGVAIGAMFAVADDPALDLADLVDGSLSELAAGLTW